MDMTGEYRIPAPRQRVWEALNDPLILKRSIPGCESLDKVSDNELEATVRAKVGPVSAKFQGKVTLGDLNPPESYTISGEGKGGAAGFAKGGATVRLTEEEGGITVLRYEAKADVGGKLAQIGSRLIQGTSKKMADDFFGRFSEIVGGAEAPAAAPEAVAPAAEAAPPAEPAPAAAPVEAPAAPVPPPQASVPPQAAAPPRPAPAVRGGLSQNPLIWVGTIVLIVVVLFGLLRACS